MSAIGDPLGTRGTSGKQFVDQIVDRDQRDAGDWREHVDDRAVGMTAVVHGGLMRRKVAAASTRASASPWVAAGAVRPSTAAPPRMTSGSLLRPAAPFARHLNVQHWRG